MADEQRFDPAKLRKDAHKPSIKIERATKRADQKRQSRHQYHGFQSMAKFTDDRVPPTYLIDGILQRGFLYTVTGATGHGKTTVCLEMAQAISSGTFFGEAEVMDSGSVVVLAGENPDNVRTQAFANCLARGIKPQDSRVMFHPGRFDIEGNLTELLNDLAQIDDLRLVIIDTAQAFFQGDNENDNNQMVKFAEGFRPLCELPQRPSVLILAHPSGKKADRDNLVPRGGSAMLAEIDGNFTIWKGEDNEVTFSTQGKHRGPYFEPLALLLEARTFPEIVDNHGRQIPVAIARLHGTFERMRKQDERDREVVKALELYDRGPVTIRDLAAHLGCSTGKAAAMNKKLKAMGCITQKSNKINDMGRAYLEPKV